MPWALIFWQFFGDPCDFGDFSGGILGCCPNGKDWDKFSEICGFCWLKLSKIPLWGVSDSEPILKITLPLASFCTIQHTCREVEENIVVSNQSLVHIYEHSNMQTNIAGNLPPRWILPTNGMIRAVEPRTTKAVKGIVTKPFQKVGRKVDGTCRR